MNTETAQWLTVLFCCP